MGLIHVYTGDGKGKTTAALGVAMRALGWGKRVCMIQFIKGYADIGEGHFAEEMKNRFVLRQFARQETRGIDEDAVYDRKIAAEEALTYAESVIAAGKFDLVILDEINNALHYRLIDIKRVLDMLRAKPVTTEIILTGRYAPQAIIDIADYVTEMRLVKHPFERHIAARKGIDY